MDARPTPAAFPGPVQHADATRADADLARDARAHLEAHPGARFVADVAAALHAGPDAVRTAAAFYEAFPPRVVMDALEKRPDLRARIAHALTGAPLTLLRRTTPGDLAAQIELLAAEDLPPEERAVRAEDDRTLSVTEIYRKYLDPNDASAYLQARALWLYESNDAWWERATDSTRRLMAAEIKSLRRHKLLTDTELIDRVGNEVLERDLPLRVRTEIRAAARRAALDGRAFTDTDLIDCVRSVDGGHDLIDELVASVALPHLRQLVQRAAEAIGLAAAPATAQPAASATPAQPAPTVSQFLSATAPATTTPPTTTTTKSTSVSIPPPAATPSIAPAASAARPSVRPAALVTESTAKPAPTPSVRPSTTATKPANGAPAPAPATALASSGRSSELPMVELVDDESYGQETTNSGDKPMVIEPIEGTDVDAMAKVEPSRPNKRR